MYVSFQNMPAQSRVWVYQSNRRLEEGEEVEISGLAKQFVDSWAAHNAPLKASYKLFYNQFLVILVDEGLNQASGCSIDASVHLVKQLEQRYGVNFFDRTKVAFLMDNDVQLESIGNLKNKISEGVITPETLTFTNLVRNKEELEEKWVIPAGESWLKRYFSSVEQH